MPRWMWIVIGGICSAIALVASILVWMHWWAIHTGTMPVICGNAPCARQPWYNFFSGFGSDISEFIQPFAFVGAAYAFWRAHECHNLTCHRPYAHVTADGHRLCKKCIAKPLDALNLHDIHKDHTLTAAERQDRQ